MNAYQERVLQSFRRDEGWFAANPEYVAGNASLGHQLETLDGIVSRMSDHAAGQDTERSQTLLISKDEVEKRREVLTYHMAPIAKIARALQGIVPGIRVLAMPKGNVSAPEIVTAATAMAQKAEIYKEVLVESGLPADFVEQLKQAAGALKASIDGRGLARASRVAATKGVGSEQLLGRRIVSIIDAVVTRQVRSDAAKLAEWQQLKRVTLRGVAVRAPVALVDTRSVPVEASANVVVVAPGSVVKAA
jgi:hypothetical protein